MLGEYLEVRAYFYCTKCTHQPVMWLSVLLLKFGLAQVQVCINYNLVGCYDPCQQIWVYIVQIL